MKLIVSETSFNDQLKLVRDDRSLEVHLPSGHVLIIHPHASEVYVNTNADYSLFYLNGRLGETATGGAIRGNQDEYTTL